MRPLYLVLHPDAAGLPTDFQHPLEILQSCHDHIAHHCFTLQKLSQYLRTQGCDARAREKAANVLRWFEKDGHWHRQDEERDLFPRLLAASNGRNGERVTSLIIHLQSDHQKIDASWRVLQAELQSIARGESAMLSDTVVEQFATLHREHMDIEEEQLMPLARSRLTPAELANIGQSMAVRRATQGLRINSADLNTRK